MPMPPSTAPENLVSSEPDELEPPSELCCCITGDLMDDPVTAMDGHTYERSAIEAWFSRFNSGTAPTSPLTNESLPSRRLIPSHNIRSQCKTWKAKLGIDDEVIADPLAGISSTPSSRPPPTTSMQRQPAPANRSGPPPMSSSEHSNSNGARRNGGPRPSSVRRSTTNGSNSSSNNRERTPNRDNPGRERVPSRRVAATSGAPPNNRRASLGTQRSSSNRRLSSNSKE